MISIVTTISTALNKLGQRVSKVFRMGRDDVREAIQSAPHGIDANPVKDMVAVYADGQVKGQQVILGYLNKNCISEVGGIRVYSTNTSGAEQIAIYLRANGTIEVGGDSDFMVRYEPMAATIDEIKSDIATLKQAFTAWVTVPGDGGAALKAIAATWAATPLIKDIADSKINEIKTL